MIKLMRRLVVLLVLVIVCAVVFAFSVDALAKKGIEQGGTYALGTATTVDSTSVGLMNGTFSLDGFRVANPTGFSTEPFLALKTGSTAVTLSSLTKSVVEIPSLKLSGIRLNIEQATAGANYGAIMDNLKRFESTDKKDAGSKRFIIHDVLIEDTTVGLNLLPGIGGLAKQELHLPPIHLTELGSEGHQGILIADALDIIVKTLLDAVARQGGGMIPAGLANELTSKLGQLSGLTSVSATISNEVNKVAGDVLKVVPNVGDLLGGKKKKN